MLFFYAIIIIYSVEILFPVSHWGYSLSSRLLAVPTSSRMDAEMLVDSARAIPAIWNASDPKHSDRSFINEQWSMIADALGVPGEFYISIPLY